MRTAQVGFTPLTYLTQLFNLPVSCPWPEDGSTPTNEHVQSWLKNNGKDSGSFGKTTFGEYAGWGTLILGALSGVIGLIKDSKALKWGGLFLAGLGGLTTIIAKYLSSSWDALRSLHQRVVFAPKSGVTITPQDLGIDNAEPVHIDTPATETSKSEVLSGYYLKSHVDTKKTVIFLNGRKNNVEDCLGNLFELQKKIPANVLVVDYRGFGKSTNLTGEVTHNGLITDAVAMYDWLKTQKGFSPEDINVIGASLGGAVAIELANRREVNTLVVQSSFTTIKDVVQQFAPNAIPQSMINFVTSKDEFNSIERIKTVKAKNICIIHGLKDPVIYPEHSERLKDSAEKARGEFVYFFPIENAGHTDCHRYFTEMHIKRLSRLFGLNEVSTPAEAKIA